MGDIKPLKLTDLGDGAGKLEEFAASDTLPSAIVGLGSVDNTSDADKPVSAAQAAVLATKEPAITPDVVTKFWSGLKTWRDLATDVRASVLTGLSTATSSAAASSDTLLTAIGKIQGRLNLLGTAANANKQTSTTDITADALMTVGAFGLGGTGTAQMPSIGDANSTAATGFYRLVSPFTNGPTATTYTIINTQHGTTIQQIALVTTNDPRVYTRAFAASTWSAWVEVHHTANLLNIGKTPATARAALELTGDWVDLRPYLKSGYYFDSVRNGRNSYPRIRKLSCGRVELDGVVSFNETSGPTPIGVFVNVPAPFRPPLTAGGLLFADTASPLAFGACNWIVTGEVEYSPPRVHGDVMLIPMTLPATTQGGALSINGIYWYT